MIDGDSYRLARTKIPLGPLFKREAGSDAYPLFEKGLKFFENLV
jgi:hypothetical protein